MPPKKNKTAPRTQASGTRFSSRTKTPTKKAREFSEVLSEGDEPAPKRSRSTTTSKTAVTQRNIRARTPVKASSVRQDPKASETEIKPISKTSSRKTPAKTSIPDTSVDDIKSSTPLKGKRQNQEAQDFKFDPRRLKKLINDAFIAKDIPKLATIIDDLQTTHSESLFKDIQVKFEALERKSEEIINSLFLEKEDLCTEIDALKQELYTLKSTNNHHGNTFSSIPNTPSKSSPFHKRSITHPLEEEDDDNEVNIDMTEQITGHRILSSEEGEDEIVFRCSQTGPAGVWKYTLVVYKSEDVADMLYIPHLSEEGSEQEEQKAVAKKAGLPDYFQVEMKFPMETLKQFYAKLNRSMNKASAQ